MKVGLSNISIRKGLLRVRANVFIDDPASKSYSKYFVQTALIPVPDSIILETDYKAWLASLPENQKIWRLAPVLCHFITVPETIDLQTLQDWIIATFSPDRLATIDNIIVRPNSADLVSPFMRNVFISKKPIKTTDEADLISSVRLMLEGKTIDLNGGGKVIDVQPQTIDIGNLAVTGTGSTAQYTRVIVDNPANATGTLDVIEVFARVEIPNVQAATFFIVSGLNLSTRDADESLGVAAADVKTTYSGLSIDVETGDYLGFDIDGGRMAWNSGGVANSLWKNGDFIPCTNELFAELGDFAWSVYGTGVESGAALTQVLADTMTIVDSLSKTFRGIKSDSVALADAISKAPGLIKSETVTITDSTAKAVGQFRTDLVTIADSFSRTMVYLRTIADTLAISDAISKAISTVRVDTMTIVDSMVSATGAMFTVALADIVTITDSLSGVLRAKTYLRQQVARMTVKRLSVSRMPIFRWIIRRFP